MTIACCPGSFDPVTNGHVDIFERAARQFDVVFAAVGENPGKECLFSVEERVDMLRVATSHLPGVKAAAFTGLTVDFCRSVGATVIVKGLRGGADVEHELQMAQMNMRMGVDTAFLIANPSISFVAASLIKEIVRYGGTIEGLVPPEVEERLVKRLRGE